MPRLPVIAAAILLSAPVACTSPFEPEQGMLIGTIRLLPVEGGCWVIDARDNVRYEPIGLPEAFRVDGRQVLVTLRQRQDVGSYCMVGQLAEVISIAALPDGTR
jgi:hypothetical protein